MNYQEGSGLTDMTLTMDESLTKRLRKRYGTRIATIALVAIKELFPDDDPLMESSRSEKIFAIIGTAFQMGYMTKEEEEELGI